MRRAALIAGLLLALCGNSQAAWVKDGAGEEDIRRDQSECERTARADTAYQFPRASGGAGPLAGARSAGIMAREAQSAELCMRSKGYKQTPEK